MLKTVTYKVENVKDILLEVAPILVEHWLEIEEDIDKIGFKPDYAKYLGLQDLGMLFCAVVRVDGKIVGYCSTIVSPHLHHSNDVFAINDILYLKKEHRKGLIGYKFIKFVEEQLKLRKVSKIIWPVKKKYNFGKLLQRLGYRDEEVHYCKFIGD
jgi:predicted acetyltransferase